MPDSFRTARLEDIPTTYAEGFWDEWAHEPGYGARWHAIGAHLGVTGFGVNAYEAGEGEELVVPHTEQEYGGQEEVYVLLRGRARFICDGQEVELGENEVLYVRPETSREAVALETPTVVFMVGGIPGKPYEAWDYGEDAYT